jgi:hypothetical protein
MLTAFMVGRGHDPGIQRRIAVEGPFWERQPPRTGHRRIPSLRQPTCGELQSRDHFRRRRRAAAPSDRQLLEGYMT